MLFGQGAYPLARLLRATDTTVTQGSMGSIGSVRT